MAQRQEEIDLVVRSTVESIAASIRQNCTLDWEISKAGGDRMIAAVADWIESPPAWLKATWAEQARGNPRRQ